jgi:subtilisin family serine protease
MARRLSALLSGLLLAGLALLPAAPAGAAAPADELAELCAELWGGISPTDEPLAVCQWDMEQIGATSDGAHAFATGEGVRVGVLDSGVDPTHDDIAPNLDWDESCSFIYDDTPTAAAGEAGNGDCTNKSAVVDVNGHGTHVASTIAAPVNGIGIAGVAPDATLVAIKVCTEVGYCFADSVAAGLRYAGDLGLDVVNLSLFADPYLYYCGNEAEQRAILRELQRATRYAQQRGVLVVASAGNEQADLAHPELDTISPDWPPDAAVEREVGNNCRVAPAELPGVLTVSATGPETLADYSSVGMGVVDVAAPGGDYFSATDTVQDAILGALPNTPSDIFSIFDPLEAVFPGITAVDQGNNYGYLNGTSMAAPHAAGVAALIVEQHPTWSWGAVAAAVRATATEMPCPPDYEPVGEITRCYGGEGRTSFFGAGLVDAEAAARR